MAVSLSMTSSPVPGIRGAILLVARVGLKGRGRSASGTTQAHVVR